MTRRAPSLKSLGGFFGGLLAGALSALLTLILALYLLNMLGLVAISVSHVPNIQELLFWAYSNLRLSLIPFTIILVLYFRSLGRLRRRLCAAAPDLDLVNAAERWVDISISLFFGTGVIWTAIGMRSALLYALNGLDQATAIELGAFEILRRLVEGGILLALSTTIVGGVGGYLMRVGKNLAAGSRLVRFHHDLLAADARRFDTHLAAIEARLNEVVERLPAAVESQRPAAAGKR